MILPLHIAAGNFFFVYNFSCCQVFFHVAKISCDKRPPTNILKKRCQMINQVFLVTNDIK